jgi:hypothetical protein
MANVDTLFLDILGRAPDPGGKQFYEQQLASGAKTLDQIAADLQYTVDTGLENKAVNQAATQAVQQTFIDQLGRPADVEGLGFYTAKAINEGIDSVVGDLGYAAARGVENKATNITQYSSVPPTTILGLEDRTGGGGGGSSVTPPGSEYDYINNLYKTYLGRGASAEELASYAEILGPTIEPNEIRDFILGGVTSGEISPTQAADLLKTLPPPAAATEPLTAQGLYNQFLGGRPALEKDLQFWNDYIAQYGPDQAMAAFEVASKQERDMDLAARAASLRDQELARDGTVMKDGEKTVREGALTAQVLYNEYLGGRSALPADIDYWNNYIAVYGPDKARAAFQESAKPEKEMPVEERVKSLRDQNLTVPGSLFEEFATQRKATPAEVRSMYLSVLGREPDPEGFSYYTSQPVENLRQSFYQASLPEMEKRVGAIDVTTTIPTPVIGQRSEPTAQELYLGLGRAPDPAGLAFWESYSQPNREADFATGAAEKGEQYDPTKPMTIGLPGQTTTTSLSGMTPQQRDLSRLVVSKMPQPVSETTTAPSVFSPENVAAQLELERLKAMNAPRTTDQGTPVAGFAQGGLVNDDINRMLQNQRNAVMRESQSRRMLNTLGAPPVKKFSDGGPAGSSSGVRRLKMSGYQAGGDVSPAMMTPEQLDEFNRNMQRELDEENRRFEKSGGPEFYSAIRPAMEDINERVKQTLELYRMGRATEADVQKLLPSLSEYEIASQFGRTDTGGYRSRDIDAPSRDRLREFIEIQKPTIDADRPDMFPYDPRGSKAQGRVLEMSKGGDVTDEMLVGTAPSEESQQTTGEYIKGLYKENIPVHARVYLETLLGKKDPITAEDFTKEELADIEKLLSSKPAKGAVTEYSDYEKVRDLDREGRHSSDWLENLPSVGKTLGRFTYETLPDGRRVIKDTYDFYNTSRSINVQEFEEMGPEEKALAVFKRITADRSVMDPPFVKRAADILGEAYIGRDGRPVKVEYDPKDLPVKRQDGSPSQGEISDDMFLGTRPEDFPETSPVDKKAGELLRALSEGTRGFVGAEPIEAGSEAYRTGQALANMPAVGVVAATAKGAGKAKDALKALTKKDIKLIASELETSRGQLAELAKKYPQLRDASVADIEALTKGEPFTAFRGISLLPGRELRKESTPSMTVDPSVALGMLKDAPVMITKEGFITATPVLRQYPGMKASETQVYVPSLIEQITERQPGALEMKIPTRSGEKMTVADVFKEVKGEKELLADVSKKEPRDILFDRYQGGVGDRYLMEVARRVLAGKWDGGEALLKEIGGYQTDPKGLVQEFDSFAELVKESALKKAKGGEVTNDEFIQEMMTGTRPSDFPETSPVDTAVSDYLKFQSKAVTDPKAYMQALGENIKKYHTDPLQQDPQKYLMEQLGPGQGLMGAIKPRGGIMPTTPGTPWGEYIDEVVGAAQKSYANIASDRREGVVDFIKKKLDKYIRSDFGTEEDPLRRAIESGRLETFGKDKDTFRSYALKAAREGDPDAVFDVTKAYDIGTGIRPTVMLPTRDFGEGQLAKQKAVDDLVSKIVAEGGDPEIARSIVERQLRSVSRDETDKALQTGEEGYSKVLKTFGVDKNRPKDMGFFERALDQGDIAYGKDFLNLQFLRPQDLAEALGAIPSNKLASMDFPEAVVEGNRLMKKSRDLDENIKIAEKGKGSTLPKEILFFGTKPLKTPAKSGQWINITDPDAARLEGALMRHSVHGYGKEGPYGLGGKQALLSGKANLFSLRDEKGLPMVTVEMENMAMQKMSDREALKTPDFKVRQVQGKFNSAPEDYIDDVFDLAETINGRWSEGPAGNQRYGKDRSGKDLDEPKIIEWGKLFANRKAQGKAAGGEITKFIKDNR